MNLLQAALLGIIEGLTEFLPISSTFHLILGSKLLGLPQTDFQKVFEVVIQSGAIIAVILMYFKTIINDVKLMKNVTISFVTTSIIGLILYKMIKSVFFENFPLQVGAFLVVGVLFILFERSRSTHRYSKTIDQVDWRQAILLGLAQAISVIPGVSRAGSVLIAGMMLGINREQSAQYSFLLAVPTIMAAGMMDAYQMRNVLIGHLSHLTTIVVGMVTAFISAIFVIRWLIGYLQKHSIELFGWYRLGVVLLIAVASLLF